MNFNRNKEIIDIRKEKNVKLNIIKVEKINHVKYLKHLTMYISSLYKIILQDIVDNNIKNEIKNLQKTDEITLVKEKQSVSIGEEGFSKRKSVNVNENNKIELSDDDDSDDDFLDGLGFGDNVSDNENENDKSKQSNDSLISIDDLDNLSLDDDDDDDDDEEEENQSININVSNKKNSVKQNKKIKEEKFNFDNLRVKGMENYFLDRLRNRNPKLFKKDVGDGYKAYTKTCVAQYSKQPIPLTDAEKNYIDERDKESGIKSYDEHITYTNDTKQHYICPRFWCLQDENKKQRSLSVNQINNGECGGWDAVVWSQEKKGGLGPGKRIMEFSDTRFHLNKKPKKFLKDKLAKKIVNKPIIKFSRTRKHPDNLCVPCCFTVPTFEVDKKDKKF